MSGGVDSAIAAWTLMREGYECEGATLLLRDDPSMKRDVEEAATTAAMLGIAHHVIDMHEAFEQRVVEPFCQAYLDGLTPNPCVECNRRVKIPAFLDHALSMGFDAMATGHYARVKRDTRGRFALLRGLDHSKDQAYVLCHLSQRELSHLLLPMGDLTKSRTREIATELGLTCANRPDSQDICFIPDGDYAGFLENRTGEPLKPGSILDPDGTVVGEHSGCARYTIGQRKGIGVALGYPAYVISKDPASNTITVGPREMLCARGVMVCDWNWIGGVPQHTVSAEVKVSYRQNPAPSSIELAKTGEVRVLFEPDSDSASMPSPAPGQTVVAYAGDEVLGGGTIDRVLR